MFFFRIVCVFIIGMLIFGMNYNSVKLKVSESVLKYLNFMYSVG